MKPFVKPDFVLIENAPKLLVKPKFYLSTEDKSVLGLNSQKEHAESMLKKLKASSSIHPSLVSQQDSLAATFPERLQQAEGRLEEIKNLCESKEEEIKRVDIKLANLKIELERAKQKIRDAGATGGLYAEVQSGDGQAYEVAEGFFIRNDFMKCFDHSKAMIPKENIIGVSPDSVEGIVTLKETKLMKLIKQKTPRSNIIDCAENIAHLETLPDEDIAILKSAKEYVKSMNEDIRKLHKRRSGLNRTFIAKQIKNLYHFSQKPETIRRALTNHPQHWDPYF